MKTILRFFALDGWFRTPDYREIWHAWWRSVLCFAAGCLAALLGFLFWWAFYLAVPVAGWSLLRNWSRTFSLRRPGANRWIFVDYSRIFAGALRCAAAVWAAYLAATPWRPFATDFPPAELLAAGDERFVCGYGPRMIGPGTWQILASPTLAFLVGDDWEAQRRIVATRRAWTQLLAAKASAASSRADREALAELRRRAARADRAHLLLGRGGLPHLLDHALFGSHTGHGYDGILAVPVGWIFRTAPLLP